MLDGLLFVS